MQNHIKNISAMQFEWEMPVGGTKSRSQAFCTNKGQKEKQRATARRFSLLA